LAELIFEDIFLSLNQSMHLTSEQIDIINSSGDIKINAVAGSGKTTTIIEYAKARPSSSKILYLAFNKTVRLEAERKFAEKGLLNVKVETAHSLAYKHIVFRNNYKVSSNGYKSHEIAQILGLRSTGEKHTEYVVANHINRLVSYFCNSDKTTVSELQYLDIISEPQARSFASINYDYIIRQTREFLSKMNKGEIEIIHDFYLKKFQLSRPVLHYDYILFDEGQDSSPAMLDIFANQKATKVIVGDTHQQIYGWRHAVNSLEKVDFKTFHLSKSFRFAPDIANLAVETLEYKRHLGKEPQVKISGEGTSKEKKTKAVIARTNLGLLLNAIKNVTERKDLKKIYFEGNIHSYTYADEGASLYDVLNLYNGKNHLIRDPLIKALGNMDELEDYIKNTEDAQLSMMVEIVKEYENEIPAILNTIKERHVGDAERNKAQLIFSTVHRCKGMEYDQVELVEDFLNEDRLEKIIAEGKEEVSNANKLNEEINLLYVAITRTKNHLAIPESLLPKNFPPSPHISIISKEVEPKKESGWEKRIKKDPKPKVKSQEPNPFGKSYTFDKVRESYKDAYKPWTDDQDDELTDMYINKKTLKEMAEYFGRTKGAIMSRIKRLDLSEKYDW
jgi:F-box protein, helicase, 18